MSDQQFESSHHRKQDISEEKEKWRDDEQNIVGKYTEKQQNEKKTKKWPNSRENIIKGSIEDKQDEEEESEDQWYVEEGMADEYAEDKQDEEEESEDQWYVEEGIADEYAEDEQDEEKIEKRRYDTNKIADEYAEDEQDEEEIEKRRYDTNKIADEYAEDEQDEEKTEKRRYDTNKIDKEYLEEQQDEEQQVEAKEQSGQVSGIGFINQLRNQYKEFVAAASERSGQASRFGFMRQLPSQYKELAAAVCFLSILPFPRNAQSFFGSEEAEPQPQLVIGSAYFPLIGLLIAFIACLLPLAIGPSLHLPPFVLAALLTVALVCLTGGLHLDGLMDTCDGLFSGDRRERKLEIMHDSHVGAFGVLGGVCILLLKFAIFASLDPLRLALALLIALPIARWAMVLAIYLFPSARLTGLGVAARQTVTRPRLLIAAITSLLIALVAGHLIGFAVWMGGTLVPIIIGTWITYTLGGLTGDVYGALAETTEVVCFLMLAAMH